MFVLVACEESQRVCTQFRLRGHDAYSCDLMPCSGGHPEWHINDDVIPLLHGENHFYTMDGLLHYVPKWDMIIAHPPCTRLCNSGQRWLYFGDDDYKLKKLCERDEAIDFFYEFVNADCDKIAIENPVGIMSSLYRKPDCIYNPYDFYPETECKTTCLWLKGLPPLVPNQILDVSKRTNNTWRAFFDGVQYSYNDPVVAVYRSKTPLGVAVAMAEQWG